MTQARSILSFLVLLAAVGLLFTNPASAQRAFSVSVAPTNQNAVVVSWKVQSATPGGDFLLLPQFQVERTADLKNWTPISGMVTGALSQKLTFVYPAATVGFYRVNSIIDQEYAQLDN